MFDQSTNQQPLENISTDGDICGRKRPHPIQWFTSATILLGHTMTRLPNLMPIWQLSQHRWGIHQTARGTDWMLCWKKHQEILMWNDSALFYYSKRTVTKIISGWGEPLWKRWSGGNSLCQSNMEADVTKMRSPNAWTSGCGMTILDALINQQHCVPMTQKVATTGSCYWSQHCACAGWGQTRCPS